VDRKGRKTKFQKNISFQFLVLITEKKGNNDSKQRHDSQQNDIQPTDTQHNYNKCGTQLAQRQNTQHSVFGVITKFCSSLFISLPLSLYQISKDAY
jgi:hypothetical protein